jgi:Fe2+ transport system protein FeoA
MSERNPQSDAPREAIPLNELPENASARLVDVRGGHELQHRLAEMGLTTGLTLTMRRNHHPGPLIIQVRRTRLMLGRGMAHRIFVQPVDPEEGPESAG